MWRHHASFGDDEVAHCLGLHARESATERRASVFSRRISPKLCRVFALLKIRERGLKLAINLGTAKALGLTTPTPLLMAVDEVIE